jgi:hypothetical protein
MEKATGTVAFVSDLAALVSPISRVAICGKLIGIFVAGSLRGTPILG